MNPILKTIACMPLLWILLFSACKKEPNKSNKPPVANAGADQTITLPASTVTIDGSHSTDPENNITAYAWTKIAGPSAFNIANANAAETQLTELGQGIYQFELKVTDAGGLFSKDTLQVIVDDGPTVHACDNTNRPQVNAQLTQISTLSETRDGIVVASAGNKILFAGGHQPNSSYTPTSRVDIFDFTTNAWSTAQLSVPRSYITTAILGSKIFFAGGYTSENPSSRVDIYDAVTGTWTTAELSVGRGDMAAAAAGNKVLFAGGASGSFQYSNQVDIYDGSTGTWTTSYLSNRTPTGTVGMTATAVGNKIYIAGEGSDWYAWDFGSISSTINIYDVSANTWSTSDLSIPRGFVAAIAVGAEVFWAGGLYKQPNAPFTNLVEIRDANTGYSTFSCLFQPNAFFSVVQKNNQLVFFTSDVDEPTYWYGALPVHNKFDIYDVTTNTWSIGVLSESIRGASIISVNNTVYVAGGYINGVLSNKVWKLEF